MNDIIFYNDKTYRFKNNILNEDKETESNTLWND